MVQTNMYKWAHMFWGIALDSQGVGRTRKFKTTLWEKVRKKMGKEVETYLNVLLQ